MQTDRYPQTHRYWNHIDTNEIDRYFTRGNYLNQVYNFIWRYRRSVYTSGSIIQVVDSVDARTSTLPSSSATCQDNRHTPSVITYEMKRRSMLNSLHKMRLGHQWSHEMGSTGLCLFDRSEHSVVSVRRFVSWISQFSSWLILLIPLQTSKDILGHF